jgi:hypothetical protein
LFAVPTTKFNFGKLGCRRGAFYVAFALRRRQSREAARSKNGEKGDEQVYRGRRLIATQWQPVHAQAILGSIPEEFRGDWYWQENTNGPEIYRSGACKLKAGFF